jgi:hypothetical protein
MGNTYVATQFATVAAFWSVNTIARTVCRISVSNSASLSRSWIFKTPIAAVLRG